MPRHKLASTIVLVAERGYAVNVALPSWALRKAPVDVDEDSFILGFARETPSLVLSHDPTLAPITSASVAAATATISSASVAAATAVTAPVVAATVVPTSALSAIAPTSVRPALPPPSVAAGGPANHVIQRAALTKQEEDAATMLVAMMTDAPSPRPSAVAPCSRAAPIGGGGRPSQWRVDETKSTNHHVTYVHQRHLVHATLPRVLTTSQRSSRLSYALRQHTQSAEAADARRNANSEHRRIRRAGAKAKRPADPVLPGAGLPMRELIEAIRERPHLKPQIREIVQRTDLAKREQMAAIQCILLVSGACRRLEEPPTPPVVPSPTESDPTATTSSRWRLSRSQRLRVPRLTLTTTTSSHSRKPSRSQRRESRLHARASRAVDETESRTPA